MTKCIYCGNEVIDSGRSDVCQDCVLEGNTGKVLMYDPMTEFEK